MRRWFLIRAAQRGEHFGLNAPGHDDQQFALNLLHWLARRR